MSILSRKEKEEQGEGHPAVSDSPPCLICGSTGFSIKYDLGAHKILRCRDCTFMWLFPAPAKEELKEIYDINYYQNQSFYQSDNCIYGYFDYFSERINKQANFLNLMDEILEHLDDFQPEVSRFLDIGCGLGYLLDVASDKSFQVAGIEFNPAAVERIKQKYVFPVFCGDFMDYQGEPYDVICMLDVIEHLADPKAAVVKMNQLLRPGGVLVISTMDCDSLTSRLLGKRLEDFRRVREHLFFFNRRTMTSLLEKAGFEILKIRSYGSTFRLDLLIDRIRLVSPLAGNILGKIVRLLHISYMNIYINPHTKMVLFLRKKND